MGKIDPFATANPFQGRSVSKAMTESIHVRSSDTPGPKVYVKLDMEGITGVVSPEQLMPGNPDYDHARAMMMQDLQAALEGAFAAGCSEALVYDAHGSGRNVDLTTLDRRATVIVGRPQPTNDFVYGLDDSFEALFLVGYHARAGAAGAMFAHTYDGDIVEIRVNGTAVGEIGLEAGLAGDMGVPLVLVSSDAGGVREARELIGPDLETVEVKRAVTQEAAICLSGSRTRAMLRQAAARAIQTAPDIPLVVFPSPAVLEVDFADPQTADALADMAVIERIGDATVKTEGPNILAAYRSFTDARQGKSARRTELKRYRRPQGPSGRAGSPQG